VTLEPPVLIVADGQVPPDRLVAMCDRAEIPLFVTGESAGHVIDVVRGLPGAALCRAHDAPRRLMDILGLGVLLTGESGLGKSELGLELISRATASWPTTQWTSTAPRRRRSRAAARNCCRTCSRCEASACSTSKAIFGETAVRRKMRVHLLVHLVRKETMEREFERLPYEPLYEDILGLPVRQGG